MTTGYEWLLQGNFFQAMVQPYIDIMGVEMFYLLLLGIMVTITYIKTRNPGIVGLLVMLTGSVIIPFIPKETQLYFFGIVIVGFATALYSVMK